MPWTSNESNFSFRPDITTLGDVKGAIHSTSLSGDVPYTVKIRGINGHCGSLRPGLCAGPHLSQTRLITLKVTSNIMDSLSPGPMDDEVIADSEGEMDEDDHPENRGTLIIKLWLLTH